MSLPNVQNALRNKGNFCFNPTDLSLAYPHGGTGLGLINKVVVKPMKTNYMIRAEEFGNEVTDVIDGGQSWLITATLRSFDDNAISKIFPNTSIGSKSKTRVINHSGAVRAGSLISSRSIVLIFSPEDIQRNPMVIFYKALPLIDETSEFNFNLDTEFALGVQFVAIRDNSERVEAIGKRDDLSL